MQTKILLIRHAQSVANEQLLFGGITDYELSDLGKEQAKELVDKLKKYKIDKIYASSLKRTQMTIAPTADFLGMNVEIVDDLREVFLGDYENTTIELALKEVPFAFECFRNYGYFDGLPNQEKVEDLANRMYNIMLKLAKENLGKTIVVVTHECVSRAFLCLVKNIDFKDSRRIIGKINNASITEITYENDKFEL